MTSIVGEAEVLKIDERGRVRVPVERREALLDEFEKSGMSGAKFARFAGVNYGTFATWAQRRRQQRAEAPASESGTLRLVEATVENERSETTSMAETAGLLIELPGGGRVSVESPMQLRLVAELLMLMAQERNPSGFRRC